jgi:hypothetical protein
MILKQAILKPINLQPTQLLIIKLCITPHLLYDALTLQLHINKSLQLLKLKALLHHTTQIHHGVSCLAQDHYHQG